MAQSPDSYSALEQRFLTAGRRALALAFAPLVALLARLNVPPNAVSLSQVALGALVVLLVPTYPRLSFVLFVLAVALDGVDGALARATGRTTNFGALLDQYCDHLREVLVVAGLAAHGALSPPLAALYALAYPGFNLTLYLCNRYGAPVPVAAKTYLTFYPALFLYLWFDRNVLDAAAALSVALMGLVGAQGLWRLHAAMDRRA